MRNNFLVALLAGMMLFGAGCSVWRTYQVGKNTPLEAGEVSPRDAAKPYADAAGAIHPLAGPAVLALLTAFGSWKRGQRINKGLPVTSNPITNYWGIPRVLEGPIQSAATVARGLFDFGKEGTAFKGSWPVIAAGAIASLLLPVLMKLPVVSAFVVAHPDLVAQLILLGTALIAGLQEKLSIVLPPPSPTV